jgi:AcrR family transcriptional regulator
MSITYTDKQIQILKTAEQLFAQKGFDGTSVRDIADEAGVNVSMISYYFRSKEKLMEALFEERMGHITMRVEGLLKDSTISPLQKVNTLIDDTIGRIMERKKFYRIVFCEQILNKNPMIINIVNQYKIKNVSIISEIIKEGERKQVFKKNADVSLMMNTLVGTVAQTMVSLDYYKELNNLQNIPDDEFEKLIKRKLSIHIKTLFKAILTYEA